MREQRPVGLNYRIVDRLMERASWALNRYVEFKGVKGRLDVVLVSINSGDKYPANEYPLKLEIVSNNELVSLSSEQVGAISCIEGKGKEKESDVKEQDRTANHEPLLRQIHLDIHTGAISEITHSFSAKLPSSDKSRL
jgi:hypothetical protein